MIRLYARALRGRRVADHVPHRHYHATTMMSALRLEGPLPTLVYEGGTDVPAMQAYFEHSLLPTLGPEDIVALDNLAAHKDPSLLELVRRRGATIWFLPPYSPDLNPIEKMWSKVKAALRKAAARTRKALLDAIRDALLSVTPRDIQGWFAECGYGNTIS